MMNVARLVLGGAVGLVAASLALAADPCESGLKPGQRPGPYSAHVAVGAERGKLHCYICETADRPAVVVFAHTPSDDLARLLRGLDKAVTDNKAAEFRAWATFLSDDQAATDPKLVDWAKKQAIRQVPLAVFEDAGGPPAYKLNKEADVTVLLFVKQKVEHNFAFRAGELTEEKVKDILKAVPTLVKSETPTPRSEPKNQDK